MRQSRYRGFGEAAAPAEFLIAEHAITMAKAGQHLESARQRRDEVAVLGRRLALLADGTLRGLCIDSSGSAYS